MRSIERYVIYQLAVATGAVTAALTGAIWLTQSLRFIEFIVDRGLPVLLFLKLTGLTLPTFLAGILPAALLAAILFVYNKLISDSEIVVLRAAGVSQFGLARPAIYLGIILTLFSYGMSLFIVPATYHAFKSLQFTVRNDLTAVMLREGIFNHMPGGLTIFVRDRGAGDEVAGVLVHDERTQGKATTMMAEKGRLVQTPTGPRLIMVNGNRQQVDPQDGRLSILYFDSYSLDLNLVTDAVETRWREPRERFLHELLWPADDAHDRAYRNQLQVEGHQRIASPLLVLTFALIAVASLLSGQFNRRGAAGRVLSAALFAIAVQAGAIGLERLAIRYPALIPGLYFVTMLPGVAAMYWLLRSPSRARLRLEPLQN
jgi:lipopolysaccharide export system permease protein